MTILLLAQRLQLAWLWTVQLCLPAQHHLERTRLPLREPSEASRSLVETAEMLQYVQKVNDGQGKKKV